MENKTSSRKGKIIFFLSLLVLILFGGYEAYEIFLAPNVNLSGSKSDFIYIHTGADYKEVLAELNKSNILSSIYNFTWAVKFLKYKKNVRAGKYLIRDGMSNKDLVLLLRSGKQTPVKLTFNNLRTKYQLAALAGHQLEADSSSIADLLNNNEFLARYQLNDKTVIGIFIPNTYEFYWNTSAEKFFTKMKKEYDEFWNSERREKAEAMNLRIDEVSTLASIVEQETSRNEEKPVIAGVYYNRLIKGWTMDADPTLIFALGDFTIRRVLDEHKAVESPYNTYKYAGLPPGPICIPSIASIDAVLNYQKHNYMFFCAKEDFSGYHTFASTYAQHLINAHNFHKELNKRKIH